MVTNRRGFLSAVVRYLLSLGSLPCIQAARAGTQPGPGAASEVFAFPKDFVWGTGTSSYQVEGAWNVDGRGESIWDRFSHTAGKVKNGDTGDVACDHFHLYPQDVKLAKDLNLNSYRFSLAWPRIQPAGRGAFNEAGMAFYDRLIDDLLKAGIAPFVTLYHWDLPQELQEKLGGWAHRDVAKYFAEYAAKATDRYSDRVRHWTTFNEPWCTSFLGYENGYHAPGIKDPAMSRQVAHNLLLSHGMATQAIRAHAKKPVEVGIVLNFPITEPLRPDNKDDVELAEQAWRRDCGAYLDPLFKGVYGPETRAGIADLQDCDLPIINQKLDFLGINFYSRNVVSKLENFHPIEGSEYTAMDWEISPKSLRTLLTRIHREYNAPVLYVTENGAAFDDTADGVGNVDDVKRRNYIREHVQQVALAAKDGVNVKGYFAWSLMDNFEWAEGYTKRFGIVYVDFPTQKRTIKTSGKWFAELAARNKIEMS